MTSFQLLPPTHRTTVLKSYFGGGLVKTTTKKALQELPYGDTDIAEHAGPLFSPLFLLSALHSLWSVACLASSGRAQETVNEARELSRKIVLRRQSCKLKR
jgi:hypothetical protein